MHIILFVILVTNVYIYISNHYLFIIIYLKTLYFYFRSNISKSVLLLVSGNLLKVNNYGPIWILTSLKSCALKVQKDVFLALDNRPIIDLIVLDLSTAFDTMDYAMFLAYNNIQNSIQKG